MFSASSQYIGLIYLSVLSYAAFSYLDNIPFRFFMEKSTVFRELSSKEQKAIAEEIQRDLNARSFSLAQEIHKWPGDFQDFTELVHPDCGCKINVSSKTLDQNLTSNRKSCSKMSQLRGFHQKVLSFSLHNLSESSFDNDMVNIKENILATERLLGNHWTMRLYHKVKNGSEIWNQLCGLACEYPETFDLCYDGSIMKNYLPILDDQVEVMLFRKLSSRPIPREVVAVREFLQSSKEFHVIRDHPDHDKAVTEGLWGVKLTEKTRKYLKKSFERSNLSSEESFLENIWPWAKSIALEHDSYHCQKYPGSIPIKRRRINSNRNYVGFSLKTTPRIPFTNDFKCPLACRHNPDWNFC